MNLGEIKEECWAIARDTALDDEDKLWPSAEMDLYANRVYKEIARETLCILDATTVDVCQIASDPVVYTDLVAGTLDYIWANDPEAWLYQKNVCPYLYTLHPSIIKIHEVKWTKRQWKLTNVSSSKWQDNVWWEQVIGMPTEFALDLEAGKLALNFRSESSDVMRLQVSRMPLANLSSDSDVPEIKEAYHQFFFNGMLALMYSKEDVDTINEKKADSYKMNFLKDIDQIKQLETKIHERLRPNYSMGAFR